MNRYARRNRNKHIVRLYKEGVDVKELASQFGMSVSGIYYILAKLLTDEADTTHRIEQQDILEREIKEREGLA